MRAVLSRQFVNIIKSMEDILSLSKRPGQSHCEAVLDAQNPEI